MSRATRLNRFSVRAWHASAWRPGSGGAVVFGRFGVSSDIARHVRAIPVLLAVASGLLSSRARGEIPDEVGAGRPFHTGRRCARRFTLDRRRLRGAGLFAGRIFDVASPAFAEMVAPAGSMSPSRGHSLTTVSLADPTAITTFGGSAKSRALPIFPTVKTIFTNPSAEDNYEILKFDAPVNGAYRVGIHAPRWDVCPYDGDRRTHVVVAWDVIGRASGN